MDKTITLPLWAINSLVFATLTLLGAVGWFAKRTLDSVGRDLVREINKLSATIAGIGDKLDVIRLEHIRHDERIKNLYHRVEGLEARTE